MALARSPRSSSKMDASRPSAAKTVSPNPASSLIACPYLRVLLDDLLVPILQGLEGPIDDEQRDLVGLLGENRVFAEDGGQRDQSSERHHRRNDHVRAGERLAPRRALIPGVRQD